MELRRSSTPHLERDDVATRIAGVQVVAGPEPCVMSNLRCGRSRVVWVLVRGRPVIVVRVSVAGIAVHVKRSCRGRGKDESGYEQDGEGPSHFQSLRKHHLNGQTLA